MEVKFNSINQKREYYRCRFRLNQIKEIIEDCMKEETGILNEIPTEIINDMAVMHSNIKNIWGNEWN